MKYKYVPKKAPKVIKSAPTEKNVSKPCDICDGQGLQDNNTLCPACNGSGQI